MRNTTTNESLPKLIGLHYEQEKLSSSEFPPESEPRNRVLYGSLKLKLMRVRLIAYLVAAAGLILFTIRHFSA